MRTIAALIVLTCALPLAAQEQTLPPKLQQEAQKIVKWSEDQILVNAVREQNKSAMTMEQIQKLDQEWIHGTIPEAFVQGLLTNPCAVRLKEFEKAIPSALESFVMDDQGALVCTTKKTSDYYQGDEAKWQDAFKAAKGAIVTGKRQYDESTKSTLVHVSTPILYEGKNIGAIAVGISLTKLAEE